MEFGFVGNLLISIVVVIESLVKDELVISDVVMIVLIILNFLLEE